MDIANVIKDLRRKQAWEQDDLAKRLGTSQQTVSNWESGTLPRAAALLKINALLKDVGLPTVSLTTVAIKANERSGTANKVQSMLVIVQPDAKQPGVDRLLAMANRRGMTTFVTQSADQAADLLENLTP